MEIYEYGNKDASIVLVQLVDGHMLGAIQEVIELINVRTDVDYSLVVFKVDNWNSDLSPWPSPAVFGIDNFAGNAKDTLAEIVDYCKDINKTYYKYNCKSYIITSSIHRRTSIRYFKEIHF